MTDVIYLTTEALLRIADRLGVRDIRDLGLLDSAAQRPQSTVFGKQSYPSMSEKGAALMQSIIGNHPLIDGNKRLGWTAITVFYAMNETPIHISNDEAYEFTLAIAAGTLDFPQIASQLEAWTNSER